jgi:hypothetical protein
MEVEEVVVLDKLVVMERLILVVMEVMVYNIL